jgi:type I restriction enzyme S subunit
MKFPLSEIFEFVRNGLTVQHELDSGGLPITRIETIANATINLERVGYAGISLADAKQYLLQDGDILFSHINSVSHLGKCAIYNKELGSLVHGMNLLCFRVKREKLLPKFALYLIRSNQFKSQLAKSIKKSVNQASVSTGDIKKIVLNVPPLEEQQRISTLLDTADCILRLRESAIAKLDALAQSWFNELISQPNIDHINLKQLCEISSGFAFKSELYSDDGNAHIIRISDIQNSVVTIKESARMALSNVGKGLTCKLNSNDILMAMSGATTGKFGILEDIKTTQVFLNQRVGRFVIKDEKKLSRQFLIALINSDFYKSHVLNTAAGAAQPNISSKQLVDIEIKLPSLIQQSEFSKRIEIINNIKQSSMAFIERESALIASLQHQSFPVN